MITHGWGGVRRSYPWLHYHLDDRDGCRLETKSHQLISVAQTPLIPPTGQHHSVILSSTWSKMFSLKHLLKNTHTLLLYYLSFFMSLNAWHANIHSLSLSLSLKVCKTTLVRNPNEWRNSHWASLTIRKCFRNSSEHESCKWTISWTLMLISDWWGKFLFFCTTNKFSKRGNTEDGGALK